MSLRHCYTWWSFTRDSSKWPHIHAILTGQTSPQAVSGDNPPCSTPRPALNLEWLCMASYSPYRVPEGTRGAVSSQGMNKCWLLHGALPGLHRAGPEYINGFRSSAADEQSKHQKLWCFAQCWYLLRGDFLLFLTQMVSQALLTSSLGYCSMPKGIQK